MTTCLRRGAWWCCWLVATVVMCSRVIFAGEGEWSVSLGAAEQPQNPAACGNHLIVMPTLTALYAVNLTTGHSLWMFRYPLATSNAYAVCDEEGLTAFVATSGAIFALGTNGGGRLRWSYNVTGNTELNVYQGELFVSTRKQPLFALDVREGRFVRQYGHLSSRAVWHTYFLYDTVYVASLAANASSQHASLHAIDLYSGKTRWSFSDMGGFEMVGSLLFVRVNFAAPQCIVSLAPQSGSILWNASFNSLAPTFDFVVTQVGPPGGVQQPFLFAAGSTANDAYPNYLVSVDPSSGATLWNTTIGFFYLMAGEGAVFAGGTVTQFVAYDVLLGEELWSLPFTCVNAGVAHNDWVVFGALNGTMVGRQVR